MRLYELQPHPNSTKKRKRVGRGHGCHVKTSGRGSKGQNSRSGGGKGPGFEGGQTPWYRRLPKFRGFKSRNKIEYQVVTLGRLESFDKNEVVTPEILLQKGLIRNLNIPVKILASGSLEKPLTVRVHKFSEKAKEAIELSGGKVEVI